MALATADDVAARLRRPFVDASEQSGAETLLGDAELILRHRIPDLDDRAKNDTYRQTVVMVEASMVCRVLRNPEGYRTESEGDYSYSLDTSVASGFLTVLDDEWSLLGVSEGAFTIRPALASTITPWWSQPPWNFQYGTVEPGYWWG